MLWSVAELPTDAIVSTIGVRAVSEPGRPNPVGRNLRRVAEAVVNRAPEQVAPRARWGVRAVRLGHAAGRLSLAALVDGAEARPPDDGGFDPDAHP